ncbi:MAG: hypothetical protein WC505_08110 [Patescibacteria group bacterium]
MAQEPDYIGTITFANDVTCTLDVPQLNMRTGKCVGGQLVPITNTITGESEALGYPLAVFFELETRAIVDALRRLWARGTTVSFECDERRGRAMLDTQNGLADIRNVSGQNVPIRRVRGQALDLWNGTVNLIVVARSA